MQTTSSDPCPVTSLRGRTSQPLPATSRTSSTGGRSREVRIPSVRRNRAADSSYHASSQARDGEDQEYRQQGRGDILNDRTEHRGDGHHHGNHHSDYRHGGRQRQHFCGRRKKYMPKPPEDDAFILPDEYKFIPRNKRAVLMKTQPQPQAQRRNAGGGGQKDDGQPRP
ncbi:hypothetical protein fugu_009818 [Takifugu bimaculatus]|uniref:Uncharacterized protein n=1 Tax=Takifugu bimaculatus TaxID=433685 RepID=A0A4Z2CDV4_9TELE|nr:hypothetical protein fugu_009818 [Takifugu bimaculatus]